LQAYFDWQLRGLWSGREVLPSLVTAGYAAIIGSTSNFNTSPEQLLTISTLSELKTAPTLLYVCIVIDQEFSDVTPLAEFSNLRALYLDETQVSDISALAGLDNLRITGLPNENQTSFRTKRPKK